MSRAIGANAQLLGKFETVYGTAPTGAYIKFPFVSDELDSEQGLVASDLLGQGRDPAPPTRDVVNVGGGIIVPVDLRNFGHWLKALLGAPTTTGTAPYTHTFASGASSLPSMSIELGNPDVPSFSMSSGVIANSVELELSRSGTAKANLNFIGQGNTRSTTTGGGTPTSAVMTRFGQFQGYIKKDGSALANVTSAKLTYSNNLDAVPTVRSDGKIEGVDLGVASLTGAIDVRFADTTLLDAATNDTAIALEFGYTIDANSSLIFTLPSVRLPKPKLPVSGPGGIQATFNWQASRPTSGSMLTAVLKNDVASYA